MASKSKHIHVSLSPEEVAELDALRGSTPMGTYIKAAYLRVKQDVKAGRIDGKRLLS